MEREKVLEQWLTGIRILHLAHHTSATHFARRHILLGVPVVIISTLVGTAVFTTLESSPEPWLQIGAGLLSMAAAVLSALQTFLRYADLADKHKQAAVRYGKLRREIDQFITSGREDEEQFMTKLRTEWDGIDEEAPSVPGRIYQECVGRVGKLSSVK